MFRRIARLCICLLALKTAAAAPLPDPTAPPGQRPAGEAQPRPSWHVSSIMIGPERRQAVVNGRSVHPGDAIAGARVVDILPSGVRLRFGGREFVVELVPATVKRRTGL